MAKGPLSTPMNGGAMSSPPSPHEGGCNYLEHTGVEALKQKSDTSVLTESFYADLPWSKGALDSPMGTDIANPKR